MSAALAATACRRLPRRRDRAGVRARRRCRHLRPRARAAARAAGTRRVPGSPCTRAPTRSRYAQDKLLMRERLTELGLPVPAWARGRRRRASSATFLREHGGEAVVKTPRGGYDGKGVRVVRDAADVDDWFAALADEPRAEGSTPRCWWRSWWTSAANSPSSVARRPNGEIVGVARRRVRAARRGVRRGDRPRAAGRAARVPPSPPTSRTRSPRALGVTGVLAVELFETADDRLLVNELAMRPHNSGHWSIDGSTTSQFEQHLRAVLDLPLGATGCRDAWSVMVNVLGGPSSGGLADRYPTALADHPPGEGAQLRQGVAARPQGRPRHRGRCGARTRSPSRRAPQPPTRDLTPTIDPMPHPLLPHAQTSGSADEAPLVGLVMGSDSDWNVMARCGASCSPSSACRTRSRSCRPTAPRSG